MNRKYPGWINKAPIILGAIWIGLGFAASVCPAAHYIRLKSGSELTGDLIKETPKSVYVDLGYDVVTIPRDAIESLRDLSKEPQSDSESTTPTVRTPHGETNAETGGIRFLLGSLTTRSARTQVQILDDAKTGIVIVANPSGSGSGFVIDSLGHIVTNFHVVRNERYHSVTFFIRAGKALERKKVEEVELVAINPLYDLALLKVDPDKLKDKGITLKPLPLGKGASTEPGDPVFAIGNPGVGTQILEQSVSEGIVSSTARNFNDLLYVQTTAAVNPGNSGGPLLNPDGEVVGVVTFKAFFQEGIAFALPARYLRDFLDNQKAYAVDTSNPNTGYRYLKPE